jgi:hypothetical protein
MLTTAPVGPRALRARPGRYNEASADLAGRRPPVFEVYVLSRAAPYLPYLRFVAVFVALTAAWPAVGPAWAQLYRSTASAALGQFGASGEARFEAVESPPDWNDVEVLVLNRRHLTTRERVPAATFKVSSRYTGYLEQTMLLALTAGVAMPWRRRLWVVPACLALGQLGVLARLGIAVRYQAMVDTALELGAPPAPLASLLTIVYESFVKDNLESGLIVALLIWATVAVPRERWEWLLGQDDAAA